MEDEVIRTWNFVDEREEDIAIRDAAESGGASAKGASDPNSIDSEGHRRQLVDFLEAVKSGNPPLVDDVALIGMRSSDEGRIDIAKLHRKYVDTDSEARDG